MGDDRRRDEPRPGDPAEGVRIIGAEEAAEAIERGDVAERRGDRLPRYGDRPARPPMGPKPALRFPLGAGDDPAEAPSVRPAKGVRFDPRPPPAWDDPATDDIDEADDPWPAEDTWGVPAGSWDEPHDDVVAWSQGTSPAEAPAEEPEEELSWAEGFADEDDQWDGTWDAPTGAAPAAEVGAGAGDPEPVPATEDVRDEHVPADEAVADAVDHEWMAFGDDVDDQPDPTPTRRGRRLFARRRAPTAPAPEASLDPDPGTGLDPEPFEAPASHPEAEWGDDVDPDERWPDAGVDAGVDPGPLDDDVAAPPGPSLFDGEEADDLRAADLDLAEAADTPRWREPEAEVPVADDVTDVDDLWGPPSEEAAVVAAPSDEPPFDDAREGADDAREGDDDARAAGPEEVTDEPPEATSVFDPAGGWADDPDEEPSVKVFDFADEPSGQVELPHWTDPPTGELPRVLAGDDVDQATATTGSTPAVSWQGHDGRWGNEGFDDLMDEDEERMGALDDQRPHHDDAYAFAELEPPDAEEEPVAPAPARDPHRVPPARPVPGEGSPGAGRDVGVAVGVGCGVAVVALVALAIAPWVALLLVIAILFVALAEYQKAALRAGYRPSVAVGLVASVALPLAVYAKGAEAYPILVVVTIATLFAWHLVGADGDARVVEGVGVSLLGIGWIVGFGSFGALLLSLPGGRGMLFAAIIAAVFYDIGGYAVGRSMGTRSFSDASPNKTVEGLVGGCLVSIMVVLIVIGLFGLAPFGAQPFDSPSAALKVGLFAALAAPLGDLCESLIKRDLGVKDMGSLLPEHGGLLDRFDALLFVLPAVYFATVFFDLGPFS